MLVERARELVILGLIGDWWLKTFTNLFLLFMLYKIVIFLMDILKMVSELMKEECIKANDVMIKERVE